MELWYKRSGAKEIGLTIDLIEMGLGPSSTWEDLKLALQFEFGMPINQQVLYPRVGWNHYTPISGDVEIYKYHFIPGLFSHGTNDARLPLSVFPSGVAQHESADIPFSHR